MNKRFISLISALILTLALTVPAFADTYYKEVIVDVPPKIVFLGDSIATGYGLDGYDSDPLSCNSYANQLADKYSSELDGKCETSCQNLAVDGMTSEELLEQLKNNAYNEALKDADAVVVSIGGNDLLSVLWELFSNFGYSTSSKYESDFSLTEIIKSLSDMDSNIDTVLTAFDKNISEIASYIKNKTDAVVIIQTLYNPFNQINEIPPLQRFTEEKVVKLNDCIFAHKDDDNAEYLIADVYSKFVGKASDLTRIGKMDIHPNQDGHNAIAECVDKTIRLEHYSYTKEEISNLTDTNNKSNTAIYIAIAVIGMLIIIVVITIVTVKLYASNRKDKNNDDIHD